mmetsp:Transcript_28645/g.91366  ORF Transcript_28645/g.91366 Transcript_28645/m.91366 type:complete len:488 (-) Transcript_28645:45-1508(-)
MADGNRLAEVDECNLYVGYLPFSLDMNGVRALFEPYGTVVESKVIYDKHTMTSKGYGFVRMADKWQAQQAIAALNNWMYGERRLAVRIAGQPPPEKGAKPPPMERPPAQYDAAAQAAYYAQYGPQYQQYLPQAPAAYPPAPQYGAPPPGQPAYASTPPPGQYYPPAAEAPQYAAQPSAYPPYDPAAGAAAPAPEAKRARVDAGPAPPELVAAGIAPGAFLGIGLMSGTSMDAVDAALVEVLPGRDPIAKLIAFAETPISEATRERILAVQDKEKCTVERVCMLNFQLGELFAKAANKVCADANIPIAHVHYVASHGQTVCHIPKIDFPNGWETKSTLQLAEPSIIAERTGATTVADFRPRDIAAGGQGAPLMPHAERMMFGGIGQRDILLLNLGGIANLTVLKSDGGVVAFDTGPGNMVMDILVRDMSPVGADGAKPTHDKGGEIAASGAVRPATLDKALAHPYFAAPLPKTTGREMFGEVFTRALA